MFGGISNWPKDFFGDMSGDIYAREKAAMAKKRSLAAEWQSGCSTRTYWLSQTISVANLPAAGWCVLKRTMRVELQHW